MQRKSITVLGSWGMMALLSLAAVGTGVQAASGQSTDSDIARSVEGGWLFTIVPPPGTPGPASFQALDTFSGGGGWSGHASTDRATNWSPGFGSWARVGEEIVITQYQFIEDSVGNPVGTVIVHKQVHFTGPDTVAGTSSVSFCDMNEENCFTPPGRAAFSAKRIKAAGPVAP